VEAVLHAPWTADEVRALNECQEFRVGHPLTCARASHILRATEAGWVCDECSAEGHEYRQDWCSAFTVDWMWVARHSESEYLRDKLREAEGAKQHREPTV
jgi:hypothetical protein